MPFNLISGILAGFGAFMMVLGMLFAIRWLFWPSARTLWFYAQTALFVIVAGGVSIFFGFQYSGP